MDQPTQELQLADDWRTVWALEAESLAAFWAGDTDRALASARDMAARSEKHHAFLSGRAMVRSPPLSAPTATPRLRATGSPCSTTNQRATS